jgi:hypothetical protein
VSPGTFRNDSVGIGGLPVDELVILLQHVAQDVRVFRFLELFPEGFVSGLVAPTKIIRRLGFQFCRGFCELRGCLHEHDFFFKNLKKNGSNFFQIKSTQFII